MSEIFSKLEVLSRGRYVPHGSTSGLQAQPRLYDVAASTNESQEQPLVLIVNTSDFSALEERIVRTIKMVQCERQSRMAAEERASQAEAAVNAYAQRIDALGRELRALKSVRDQAHLRLERLIVQLDALERSAALKPPGDLEPISKISSCSGTL